MTPLIVTVGTRTGLKILYDSPRDVGSDRIVDAVAAIELYGPPVDRGGYRHRHRVRRGDPGGAPTWAEPSPPASTWLPRPCFKNTSQLRRVELTAPKAAIGQNTTAAMQSGLVLGYTGLVTYMVGRFKSELGQDAKVIGTGGLIEPIACQAEIFDAINPDLTLVGLRLVHEINQQRANPSVPAAQGTD